MNLAEHFEPLDPPVNGLEAVRKKARKKAVVARVLPGSLTAAFSMLTLAFSLFFGFSSTGSSVVTDTDNSISAGQQIQPEENSLTVKIEDSSGELIVLVTGLTLMVVASGASVRQARRDEHPSLLPRARHIAVFFFGLITTGIGVVSFFG